MKRVLYTMPAVMVVLFYGMLALLAGGVGGFQLRAWLMVLMPVASAILLLAKLWWGCIPGMLLNAQALLMKNPNPTTEEIKVAMSGNLCRCTGYAKIEKAVALAASRM